MLQKGGKGREGFAADNWIACDGASSSYGAQ